MHACRRRHEHALGRETVLGEMPRVALGRVRSPEDDQVTAVANFAQRAGHFAHALKGHARGAVANAGGRVDRAADPIGNAHGHALRLARRVGESIDDGVARRRQNLRGPLDAFLERGGLAVDRGDRPIFDVVIQEPRFAQHAGPLGLDDVVVDDLQVDVVANAAAKGAGGVGDDLGVFVGLVLGGLIDGDAHAGFSEFVGSMR